MLLLILRLFMLFNEVSPNLLFPFCSDNTNYTSNSTFENNLERVLEALPSNTSDTGFYSTSIGDGADQVYGRALCRGDVNTSLCRSCIENASQDIMNLCKTEESIVWYDLCQVQYSFQNSSLMVYTGKYPESNKQETNISHPDHFNDVLTFLMNNISTEAASLSKIMFGFGEIKFNKKETIYGLVQCSRDISGSNCQTCLDSALGDLKACCYSRTGGTVLSRNCNVRFQMYHFYNASNSPLIYPRSAGDKWSSGILVAVICATALVLALLIGTSVVYCRWKKRTQKGMFCYSRCLLSLYGWIAEPFWVLPYYHLNDLFLAMPRSYEEISQKALLYELASPRGVTITQEGELVTSQEFPFLDLPTIREATDDFSDSNRLGQGGFGTVYKGVLADGKEVAVKRLSRRSWQDPEKRPQLDWKTCSEIISGIARGLLYLHEDSRLKIIHRDLKPSNVLLDQDMVAKISDFGMARIFCENQNSANTKRVVGTYGYMAPEYAMEGLFSVKSDVFSFGVIILEILCGKKNSGFYLTEHAQTLLAYAWRLWKEGKELEIVDPCLLESCSTPEINRCIHVGLLCVQEDPADRPTISDIVVVLGSDTHTIALPEPRRPASSVGRVVAVDQSSTRDP
ncbi:Cysteine-rich RLK 10, putative [Theobroma cacao]|uniref:Cysteine-rich RLK 10, putative n=1 Tax=Theobroma cacao TaxID=3641 RepID=A0A061GHE5_THECC|nr:Cysteine-rich RLK 10, putative [Theobroma cacao]